MLSPMAHDPLDVRCGTKGTHVIKAKSVIDDRLGKGTFQRLADAAGGNASWAAPLAMNWYSAPLLCEVLTAAAVKMSSTLQQLTTDIAMLNAKDDLKTIYRFFMTMVGPIKVLGRSPQMYATYINFGRSETSRNEPGVFEGIVADVPTALVPWVMGATHGFLPSACVAAGGKNAVIQSTVGPEAATTNSRIAFSMRYG
jgi:hypothetical protein